MNSNYPRIEDGKLPAITFAKQVRRSLPSGVALNMWLSLWLVDLTTLYHQAAALGIQIPLLSTWISEAAIIPILLMIWRRLDDRRNLATVALLGVLMCAPLASLHVLVEKDLEGWPLPVGEYLLFWAFTVYFFILSWLDSRRCSLDFD